MIILESESDRPIYNQLYIQLRNKIISGEFESGSKLPSMRALSKELSISRNTVEQAYHHLSSEGYIVSEVRRGFFVETIDFTSIHVKPLELENKLQKISRSESICECEKVNLERPSPPIRFDFKYGMLSPEHLPLRNWKPLMNKSLMESKDEISEYRPMFGEYKLRKEIQKYLNHYRGVDCSLDQIFIGAGVHYCLSMLCQILRLENDHVAMEDPGYHVTRSTFKNHGFNVEAVTLDHDGINIKELDQSKAKIVYVTPSHQYPLGLIMPVSKRVQLIKWAEQVDGLIIEDDYSCHLRYKSKPVQSLQSLSRERVAYIGSFSKFLFPSLRIAYMIIPKGYLETFKNTFTGYPSTVSYLMQDTLARFMNEGHWESYLKRNRKLQEVKHDRLINALKNSFGNRLTIHGANAGLHLLLEFDTPVPEGVLVEEALKQGVKVYSTSQFWSQNTDRSKRSVVLGYGGIPLEDIDEAVALLAKAWTFN